MKALIAGIFFLALPGIAFAEGGRECDQALVRSTYSSFSPDHVDPRLATFVSGDSYDAIKHDADSKATIYGVPTGQSYDDFQENVRKRLAQINNNNSLSHDQILNILWTGLSANSSSLYSKCIEDVAFSSFGLHMAVKYATANDVTLAIKYVPGFRDPKTQALHWTSNIIAADGKSLPQSINIGAGSVVVLKRPENQQSVVLNSSAGGESVILDPLPPPPPPHRCIKQQGIYDFYGDGCGDGYLVSGHAVVVSFGSGGTAVVPKNNPAYHADIGFWATGDFNGDGVADLVHFVVGVAGVDPYVQVHLSQGGGDFLAPTPPFHFRDHAGPERDYNANAGSWSVGFDPATKRATLVHDPKSPGGQIHVWRWKGADEDTFTLGAP